MLRRYSSSEEFFCDSSLGTATCRSIRLAETAPETFLLRFAYDEFPCSWLAIPVWPRLVRPVQRRYHQVLTRQPVIGLRQLSPFSICLPLLSGLLWSLTSLHSHLD